MPIDFKKNLDSDVDLDTHVSIVTKKATFSIANN